MDTTNTIKIEPSGIALSYLQQLGCSLYLLAINARDAYASGDYTYAEKHLKDANKAAYALDFPDIEMDFNFIEESRKRRNML
jgi:hypothetical protein